MIDKYLFCGGENFKIPDRKSTLPRSLSDNVKKTPHAQPCRIDRSCICRFTEGFIQVLQLGTMNDFNRACIFCLGRCTRPSHFVYILEQVKKKKKTCPRRPLEKNAHPHLLQGSIPPLVIVYLSLYVPRNSNLILITYCGFGCTGQSLDHQVWP